MYFITRLIEHLKAWWFEYKQKARIDEDFNKDTRYRS